MLKTYGVNSDLLTMMSILGLIEEISISEKDSRTLLPGTQMTLGELGPPTLLTSQRLSKRGVCITELYLANKDQECRNLLFYLFLKKTTNERIPEFFPRIVQNPEIYDIMITNKEICEVLGAKAPEAAHVILWTQFFGINMSQNSSSLLLDRRGTTYYLFHSHINALLKLIENGKIKKGNYMSFDKIRKLVDNDLIILPASLTIDYTFDILERVSEKEGYPKLSWSVDRAMYIGSGKHGDPSKSRVSIEEELQHIYSREEIEKIIDELQISMRR